jgi:multidrug transporter EmrE-like cation transporter
MGTVARNPSGALVCIALTIAFTVAGQLLVKHGVLQVGSAPDKGGHLAGFLVRAFTNPLVIAGLVCAVVAAIAWTMALSRADLGYAYPFMGLAIVLVLALTPLVFGEHVPINRWVGVAIVCIGLWVASRG